MKTGEAEEIDGEEITTGCWKDGDQGLAAGKWKMYPVKFWMELTRSPSNVKTVSYLVLFVKNKIGEYRRKLKNCFVYKKN